MGITFLVFFYHYLKALKKEEVLNDIEEKDQYESLQDFTAGKKYFTCSQPE